MCGIVGYIGQLDAKEILLKGLEKLEYRGYDSAGIAVANEQGIHVFKEKGRIADLREVVDANVGAKAGIGHTRWATHGEPSYLNAHPHQSALGRFTLVHNGVIENYVQLKQDFLQDVELKSDTDTEVVVQVIEQFVNGGLDTEEAFRKTLTLLKGSYAIALFDNDNRETIFVAKNKSPLLVGLGDTFNVVASDAMAMLQVTNEYVELMDKEMVIVTDDQVVIKNLDGDVISRASYIAELDASDIEKGTYPHYMLKETDEQPVVMRKIIQTYQDENGKLSVPGDIAEAVAEADRIYIIGCGTSYHAGLVGKQYIEMWANVPVEVHVASEFSYNMPLLSKKPLFIFLSQSGETADSRAVLVQVKALGHKALTITNVPGSTLSREADYTLLLHAGPEIAVASTKAYTAQIAVLAVLASVAADKNGIDIGFDLVKELGIAANAMEALCDQKDEMEMIAREYLTVSRNAFFIGRGLDYFVCVEGALKLKEISYIQAEGFAGGELKHGTIALIEQGTPVFALATQEHVNLSIRGNVKEVAARGANTCIISLKGLDDADDRFVLPEVNPALAPLVSVVPLQLIAYYAALHRGCDVDKPRNLAKSVTVE
ncbi:MULTISPECIES: glutamine--fructose-6-phosphate transaminase (isomerizing) [Bacillus]|jgi:glucosamine--fructose-6-phosphate aminotransferase (isomerizing)|uniref:Glutamine--fructose-6-phosphate aminotransferase [isomerizing] n=1 Tax=Bacillus mojavensis TaxID=72360 RepID=A0AAP3CMQ2_BACMO|nr:glutamine--fructose-6-phosphate transaminase (isomerizing) [Bacillus mojavensis]MCY8104516.1 glutamine--fructose-6-phosphate transaminase (isomerizing) [Bacillus mojavensis]MCY8483685.1 glutamine--fructose-6-phosphate transaminase (isomerizing) [Bacillus mojavensis]MCY8507992.1 glutamine--fructose-6-phosphate transaminase (isomerizing) [Bacillus mojavensis]MCY9093096.1 glutamine--fructose-6-phosphate transaminase (isomerizing) [Bacillus mojavensis]MCY9190783.1 glutamine--fructose-6-phosphat